MIKTKQRVSHLGNVDLIELTGPDHWSYEGVTPHFYVIRYDGMVYAYWEDKDHYDWVEDLMCIGTGKDMENPGFGPRFRAPTMELLIELIDANLGDREEHYKQFDK